MSEPRVVVVGGGLSGLAAALACADGGARVTLLEARPRLGGATFSFRREGLWVDNGQHVFLRCCTAYRSFLDRIGATDSTVLQDRMAIPVLTTGGRVGWLRRTGLPAPLHLGRALLRYPFIRGVDRLRVIRAALALGRLDPDDAELDRRTFGSWLQERGQSDAAIEALWDLIALPTLNLHADEASLALAVKVFRTGLLSEREAADVGYGRLPLSEIHAAPAARALDSLGADVHLHAPVRGIGQTGGDGLEVVHDGLRLADGGKPSRFEVTTAGGTVEADAVIVAVPHDRAPEILPPGALDEPLRLLQLGTSPIVNVHVVYDRKVMDLPFAAGIGTPVQWVFDRTEPSGLERGQYLAISISGADGEIEQRTDDLRARFLPALASLFPRAREARVERFFVTREHAATFRQAPRTRALRPPARTRVPGLLLAGAWTDTGWPATMEGAVRSGLAAARQALIQVGRTRRLPEVVAA